jgi:pimeloyl-ACP methyl ester carboxylesterase
MQRKKSVRRVIWILLAVGVGYLGLCYVLATNYLHPLRHIGTRPQELAEASIPTRYGDTPAWYTPSLDGSKSSKPVFVFAHGYGGARGSWTEQMLALQHRGFDSVALAMPGQDASPVNQVGFGLLEADVIVDAVAWMRKTHPGRKVIVVGLSMGGAATWLATKEDPSIDGIVSDCAFAKFDESMNAFFNRKVPGGSTLFAPVVWMAKRLSGVEPSSIKPVEAAKLWRGKPALVIQGTDDDLVVPSHAARLAEAAQCPIWMVAGATHAHAYGTDPVDYIDHLTEFAAMVEGRSEPVTAKP